MKPNIANSKRLDILGNSASSSSNRSSDPEVLTALIKKWGRKLGCCSVFAAAVPVILATHVSEAQSEELKRPQANVIGRGARFFEGLKPSRSNPALLRRQSKFLLPHQRGNFNLLAALDGNDDCPGRAIPGGTYTAAAPYTDSGDTTGANNTVTHAYNISYAYYSYDTVGPDHVYTFMMTARGPNPVIEVSTSAGGYQPVIYVLHGSIGGCPSGTANHAFNQLVISSSYYSGGFLATLNSGAMNYLPLNVPLHLLVDSRYGDNGFGYTLRMQDVIIANSCANPIDCPEYFIQQQYFDFLNREPDPPGLAAWLALLNNCPPGDTSCDRLQVSGAFFRSPEFQGRGYFLYRFYNVAFGRKPDYNEFVLDIGRVSGFLTDAQLEAAKREFIAEFMSRPAFVIHYNGLDNTQFVDALLSTAGIAAHQFRDFWIAALGNGTRTRAQVLQEIAESNEVYNKYYNQAFVVMQYFGYLRRDPDALYLNWIQELDATGDSRNMINGFVNSTEYRKRFSP